jgi:hypothetical protein
MRDSQRAIVAGLLIDVLTRLGGASRVDQQPADVLFGKKPKSAIDVIVIALLHAV